LLAFQKTACNGREGPATTNFRYRPAAVIRNMQPNVGH
jgi:hypothetical protein